MDEYDCEFIDSIKLSIFRALLGEVIPGLRSINLLWEPEDEIVWLYFFHDGDVNTEVMDHYSSIVAEIDADDWGRSAWCRHEVIRCSYPESLPKKGSLVFLRKEPFKDP